MNLDEVKKRFGLIFLVLVMSISFRGWFYPGMITHGDWTSHPIEAMKNWFSFPHAWESQVNPAPITPFHLSNYPIRFLFGLLASKGVDFGISERVLYHFPILFLSVFSMYYLAHVLFKNRIVSIYSTLLFGLNSYVLLLGDHLTVRMAYSLAPLVLAFFIKSVDSRRLEDVFVAGMLSAVAIAYEIRVSYIIIGMILFYSIYRVGFSLRARKGCRNWNQPLKNLLTLLIITFLLGAYWIVPYSFGGMTSVSSILPSQPWISWMKITNAVTLSHPFYSLTEYIVSFKVHEIHPVFYLIPILAFSALLLKKDKNIFFFALLSLGGIFLVKQENAPFGWTYSWMFKNFPGFNMFREASKFYLLIALGYSILVGVTATEISKKIKRIKGKSGKYISLAFLFLMFSAQFVMAWPIVSGKQKNESYYPIGEIPIEYKEIQEFIKNQPPNAFVTLWLPFKSRFSFYSNEYPVITPESSEFLERLLIQTSETESFQTQNLGTILNWINIKYVVLAPDLPLWEERLGEYIYHGRGTRGVPMDEYKQFMDSQKDLERIELRKGAYVYENKEYSPSYLETKANCFLIYGGTNILLTSAPFLPSEFEHSLVFANHEILEDVDTLISDSNGLVSDGSLTILSFFPLAKNSSFIFPANIETNNFNPKAHWSSITLSGLHPYLRQFGVDDWGFDYGKGLVFTWASRSLEEPFSTTAEDLISNFDFESKNLGNWSVSAENIQTLLLSEDAYEGTYSLKAEVHNSTWGWKTINSPLIPAEYDSQYRWQLYVKGENAHEAHAKVFEYDQNRKLIKASYLGSIGSGNFAWKEISFNFAPSSPTETAYIQLQIWHGHETTQPLPNKVWLDNVKIYDLKSYLKPNSIEMAFTVHTTGTYDIYVRYFQNKEGGRIIFYLNGEPIETINTRDEINGFVWKRIGSYNLNESNHILTLENREGFNVVNLFALIPQEEVAELEERAQDLLENKKIVYILEAESDMHEENSTISNKYGGEAGNGQIVELMIPSRVWNEIEILRPGNYTIAIRCKGNLTIKVDEIEYKTNSTELDWTYLAHINLEKGKHEIEITQSSMPYTEWNFENGDFGEWQGNIFGIQTLSLDEKSYSGNYSLKAELHASTQGWKVIQSPLIPASPGNTYKWDFYVAGENAHSVHAKIVEYDVNRQSVVVQYMGNIGTGNFTWKNINFEYTPSQNASYMNLQIWHGHETTQPLPNKVWLDNVKIYDLKSYQLSDLDMVWLYSTEKGNETIETIFTSNRTFAQVINYEKIDPTKYIVRVNATDPFMLSFAEAYNPFWIAYVNEERIESIPLYAEINGFWINQTGQLEITIEYEPQKWFYYGTIISATTFLVCCAYLTYGWTKNKAIWKRLKRKPQHRAAGVTA